MSTRAAPRATPWPSTGFVTVQQILGRNGGPLPISRSGWWQGVKDGRYPQPLKIGGRTVWRVADIDALVTSLSAEGGKALRLQRRAPAWRPAAASTAT